MPRAESHRHVMYLSSQMSEVSGGDTATRTPRAANRATARPNSVSSSSIVGTTSPTCSATAMSSTSSMYPGSVESGTRNARSAVWTAGDKGLTSVPTTMPPSRVASTAR